MKKGRRNLLEISFIFDLLTGKPFGMSFAANATRILMADMAISMPGSVFDPNLLESWHFGYLKIIWKIGEVTKIESLP
jgi:hypothetical protein